MLTCFTILVSIISLAIGWTQHRLAQRRQKADEIRNAAALTLAKVERLEELSMFYFEDVQPLIVEVSETLAAKGDLQAARDLLWKELHSEWLKARKRVLDENIQLAYVGLYGYHPAVQPLFVRSLQQAGQADYEMMTELLEGTQGKLLQVGGRRDQPATAMLGNELRQTVDLVQQSYRKRLQQALEPVTGFLTEVVLKSDEEVLKREVSPR
jgi:hypothetical protein